jgi:hypothetical protein
MVATHYQASAPLANRDDTMRPYVADDSTHASTKGTAMMPGIDEHTSWKVLVVKPCMFNIVIGTPRWLPVEESPPWFLFPKAA